MKSVELKKRGFTTVPNVEYSNSTKFLYGTVLTIRDIYYFAPVSSYKKQQKDNIVIKVKSFGKLTAEGSLRFNYMIPVPEKCLTLFNFKEKNLSVERRNLIEKEYRFCKTNHVRIQKQAQRTYYRVVHQTDTELSKNSCDFLALEDAYFEWKKWENKE